MRRIALMIGIAVLAACSNGTNSPNSPALAANDIVGQWTKLDKSLPPIDLLFTRDGDVVRARLRLSGVEANGTATVDGSQLTVRFADGRTPLVGKFLSDTELELEFNLTPQQQRLRKQSP